MNIYIEINIRDNRGEVKINRYNLNRIYFSTVLWFDGCVF